MSCKPACTSSDKSCIPHTDGTSLGAVFTCTNTTDEAASDAADNTTTINTCKENDSGNNVCMCNMHIRGCSQRFDRSSRRSFTITTAATAYAGSGNNGSHGNHSSNRGGSSSCRMSMNICPDAFSRADIAGCSTKYISDISNDNDKNNTLNTNHSASKNNNSDGHNGNNIIVNENMFNDDINCDIGENDCNNYRSFNARAIGGAHSICRTRPRFSTSNIEIADFKTPCFQLQDITLPSKMNVNSDDVGSSENGNNNESDNNINKNKSPASCVSSFSMNTCYDTTTTNISYSNEPSFGNPKPTQCPPSPLTSPSHSPKVASISSSRRASKLLLSPSSPSPSTFPSRCRPSFPSSSGAPRSALLSSTIIKCLHLSAMATLHSLLRLVRISPPPFCPSPPPKLSRRRTDSKMSSRSRSAVRMLRRSTTCSNDDSCAANGRNSSNSRNRTTRSSSSSASAGVCSVGVTNGTCGSGMADRRSSLSNNRKAVCFTNSTDSLQTNAIHCGAGSGSSCSTGRNISNNNAPLVPLINIIFNNKKRALINSLTTHLNLLYLYIFIHLLVLVFSDNLYAKFDISPPIPDNKISRINDSMFNASRNTYPYMQSSSLNLSQSNTFYFNTTHVVNHAASVARKASSSSSSNSNGSNSSASTSISSGSSSGSNSSCNDVRLFTSRRIFDYLPANSNFEAKDNCMKTDNSSILNDDDVLSSLPYSLLSTDVVAPRYSAYSWSYYRNVHTPIKKYVKGSVVWAVIHAVIINLVLMLLNRDCRNHKKFVTSFIHSGRLGSNGIKNDCSGSNNNNIIGGTHLNLNSNCSGNACESNILSADSENANIISSGSNMDASSLIPCRCLYPEPAPTLSGPSPHPSSYICDCDELYVCVISRMYGVWCLSLLIINMLVFGYGGMESKSVLYPDIYIGSIYEYYVYDNTTIFTIFNSYGEISLFFTLFLIDIIGVYTLAKNTLSNIDRICYVFIPIIFILSLMSIGFYFTTDLPSCNGNDHHWLDFDQLGGGGAGHVDIDMGKSSNYNPLHIPMYLRMEDGVRLAVDLYLPDYYYEGFKKYKRLQEDLIMLIDKDIDTYNNNNSNNNSSNNSFLSTYIHSDSSFNSTTPTIPLKDMSIAVTKFVADNPSHPLSLEFSKLVSMFPPLPTYIDITRYDRRMTAKWPFSMMKIWGEPVSSSVNVWSWQFVQALLPNGYAVLVIDTRGTGASEGHREVDFSLEELTDFKHITDYVKQQWWSTGDLGMGGISYDGMTGLQAAAQGGVKAGVALFTPMDVIGDLLAPGGMVCSSFVKDYVGVTAKFEEEGNPLKHLLNYPWHYPLHVILGFLSSFGQGLPINRYEETGSNVLYEHEKNWDMGEVVLQVEYLDDNITLSDKRVLPVTSFGINEDTMSNLSHHNVSIYIAAGYCDSAIARGSSRLYEYMQTSAPLSRPKLVIGPWTHSGRRSCSPYSGTYSCFEEVMYLDIVRYLDCHIKNKCWGNVLEEPPVHYWQIGKEVWASSTVYPPNDLQYVQLDMTNNRIDADAQLSNGSSSLFSDLARSDAINVDGSGATSSSSSVSDTKAFEETVRSGNEGSSRRNSCKKKEPTATRPIGKPHHSCLFEHIVHDITQYAYIQLKRPGAHHLHRYHGKSDISKYRNNNSSSTNFSSSGSSNNEYGEAEVCVSDDSEKDEQIQGIHNHGLSGQDSYMEYTLNANYKYTNKKTRNSNTMRVDSNSIEDNIRSYLRDLRTHKDFLTKNSYVLTQAPSRASDFMNNNDSSRNSTISTSSNAGHDSCYASGIHVNGGNGSSAESLLTQIYGTVHKDKSLISASRNLITRRYHKLLQHRIKNKIAIMSNNQILFSHNNIKPHSVDYAPTPDYSPVLANAQMPRYSSSFGAIEHDAITFDVDYASTTGIFSRWLIAQHPFRMAVNYGNLLFPSKAPYPMRQRREQDNTDTSRAANPPAASSNSGNPGSGSSTPGANAGGSSGSSGSSSNSGSVDSSLYYPAFSSRLSFTSSVLTEDIDMVGSPWITFSMYVSGCTEVSIFVYLEDVDIHHVYSNYVTEGKIVASHRITKKQDNDHHARTGKLRVGSPDVVERSYKKKDYMPIQGSELIEMSLTLEPVSWTFQEGHAIRISLTGADVHNFELRDHAGILPVLPDKWQILINDPTNFPAWIKLPTVRKGSTAVKYY